MSSSSAERLPKIEFLLCGSPNDAFYSQTAMFRLALDSLGGIYARARLSLAIGDDRFEPVPDRWRRHLRNVDVVWAPRAMFQEIGDGGDFRFDVLDASCDLSFLCDADTLLLDAIDSDALQRMMTTPAIRGVIAHFPPPLVDRSGTPLGPIGIEGFWQSLSTAVLGEDIPLDHVHTLAADPIRCPFYINYGVVIGTCEHFRALYEQLRIVQPRVLRYLDNRFYAQIGVALGCHAARLPTEALPMRYNFPNDPQADAMHAGELTAVKFLHYLRTTLFDRHLIFASADHFDRFLELPLAGSNKVFQDRVRHITGGTYPLS